MREVATYFLFVRPFHRRICRALLANAATGTPEPLRAPRS